MRRLLVSSRREERCGFKGGGMDYGVVCLNFLIVERACSRVVFDVEALSFVA